MPDHMQPLPRAQEAGETLQGADTRLATLGCAAFVLPFFASCLVDYFLHNQTHDADVSVRVSESAPHEALLANADCHVVEVDA